MSSTFFFSLLLTEFPEITQSVEQTEDDHYKMERFADYTIRQIEKKNIPELKKCFNFLETNLDKDSQSIENALNVSYFEALLYYDNYKRGVNMKEMMPQTLYAIYLDYKKYYNSLR